ncbi:MAG: protease inhibitor I42 family protein [Roseiflexaceae bacterium]
MMLTMADKGKPVALKIGEPLVITLDSNPSTGYSWQPSSMERTILQQQGEPEYTPPAQPLPGAGGQHSFTFVAVGAGRSTVTLVYKRSFEPNVAPAQTFTVQVTVDTSTVSAGPTEG